MKSYKINRIGLEDYPKFNAIWNMKTSPYTQTFIEQIKAGLRDVFILTLDGEYIAECDLVYDNPEYRTIPGKRLYLSHLIVKKEQRGNGYGNLLCWHMLLLQ